MGKIQIGLNERHKFKTSKKKQNYTFGKLKKVIGVILLLMSVMGVSCGSLVNAVSPHTASNGSLIERAN